MQSNMYRDYNCPAGADNPNAPWNYASPKVKQFDMTVSQSLSRTVSVSTDDYIPKKEYGESDNTEDTDWKQAYENNNYHTPIQLICILKDVLETQRHQGLVYKTPAQTDRLIKECNNWIEDETEYIEG